MNQTAPRTIARPAAVWVLVSAGLVGAGAVAGRAARSLLTERVWAGTFEELLVAVASAGLLAGALWLWIITTLTVVDLLAGRACSRSGLTRRFVLMACGAMVVAGVSGPALAAGGTGEPVLSGLPLPDRAVAGAVAGPARESRSVAPPVDVPHPSATPSTTGRPEPIIVRHGDSLWSIAQADLGPGAGVQEVDQRWRALYAANRTEIGSDPDVIIPGQLLRPPLSENDQ